MALRIVFAGTPDFALPCLKGLCEAHDVVAVYTKPDTPSGRGLHMSLSPIKMYAEEKHIPVEQPKHFKDADTVARLKAYQADVMIVIAYGLILPQAVLDLFPLGCINVHASILPKWRGAAPIQYAILHGETDTGVTVMSMDAHMDTGPIWTIEKCAIAPEDTGGSLHDTLSVLGVQPLLDTLKRLEEDPTAQPTPQDHEKATYTQKITKASAEIIWSKDADSILCQIRAYNPWPVAYTTCSLGTMRIYAADLVSRDLVPQAPGTILAVNEKGIHVATGQGVIRIYEIQFPGKRAMFFSEWLCAHKNRLDEGDRLG